MSSELFIINCIFFLIKAPIPMFTCKYSGKKENQVVEINFSKNYNLNIIYHAYIYNFLIKGVIKLKNSKMHVNKFERGETDRFEIKLPDLGELYKLR